MSKPANDDARILLDPAVISQLAMDIPGFDRAGLLSALIECWGGQDQLAKDVFLEFQHAAKGSMVRQRILDMIARMISQHSAERVIVPAEELTDEALRRQILAAIPDLARVIGPVALPEGDNDGR